MPAAINRRALIGFAAAALCPLCASAGAAETTPVQPHPAGAPPPWGYQGEDGPAHWAELSADFRTCSIGTQQTPVDLSGAIKAQPGPL